MVAADQGGQYQAGVIEPCARRLGRVRLLQSRNRWPTCATGHMPNGLLGGSFLFRSGFLLITGLLAGYLREQARRAETALQVRLEQANLFNEVTATLTTTVEEDATLGCFGDGEVGVHLVEICDIRVRQVAGALRVVIDD